MKKLSAAVAGCAFVTMVAGSAALAETRLGVSINLGNAPPPPVVVVQRAPRTVWLPEERLYVVQDTDWDYDTFQVGSFWYSYDNGWWYRSRSWRGPYVAIDYRDVPVSVQRVPPGHWKHHWNGMAPGYSRDYRGRPVYVGDDRGYRGRGHDNGRGHGHGNGRWKDRD
jgi:hypothetical protein